MSAARAANALWHLASRPRARRFQRALRQPEDAQRRLLRAYLRRNAETAYGRTCRFADIEDVEAYRRRVPIVEYDDLAPFIERVRRGEPRVLTAAPVRRLLPSSGSTAARKLIPWTDGLGTEFRRAVAPWICDLFSRRPDLRAGPAYWSVSPAVPDEEAGDGIPDASALPIGFEEDGAYLGGLGRRLVRGVLAVPESVRLARDAETFRYVSALGLLRARELRLVSVWHPSFLVLLLEAIRENWARFVRDIAEGAVRPPGEVPPTLSRELRGWRRADRSRAGELESAGPEGYARIWPRLGLVSCWADGPSAGAARELGRRLPGVPIQAKGLLATEGVVSIPFARARPLAVRSHFFEFVDEAGLPRTVSGLRSGETYGVLLTTGAGLYRYRLGDRVRVEGFLARTPCLRFVGRQAGVSDLRGEKLAAGFVADALERLFDGRRPTFAMLAPDEGEGGPRYTLYIERSADSSENLAVVAGPAGGSDGGTSSRSAPERPARWDAGLSMRLDAELSRNPHYLLCRRIGQLGPPAVFRVRRQGHETYLRHESGSRRTSRMGDVKPVALSDRTGWNGHFEGGYVDGAGQRSPSDPARE